MFTYYLLFYQVYRAHYVERRILSKVIRSNEWRERWKRFLESCEPVLLHRVEYILWFRKKAITVQMRVGFPCGTEVDGTHSGFLK